MMIAIALLWFAILLFKAGFAWQALCRPQPSDVENFGEVTLVQPILSGDPALESVLESNLLSLNSAHFLWLTDDEDTQAAAVTARLQQRYPHHMIDVVSSPAPPEGVNPKLYKLDRALARVTSARLMVLDDDAYLTAKSLGQMLTALEDNTLVTALPWYQSTGALSCQMLAQFVNDNSAMTYLPLLPFSSPLTLNGMCYVIPVATLKRTGGFTPLLRFLTDDLALASHLEQHRVRIIQSVAPVCVQTSVAGPRAYFRQMHRWFLFATLLLREKSLPVNGLIFLLQGLHPLLLWGMILLALSGEPTAWIVLATCLLVRQGVLSGLQRKLSQGIPTRPVLSLVSELLQPLHLFHALLNRTIYWRSRRYRVLRNDRFTSL